MVFLGRYASVNTAGIQAFLIQSNSIRDGQTFCTHKVLGGEIFTSFITGIMLTTWDCRYGWELCCTLVNTKATKGVMFQSAWHLGGLSGIPL